MPAAFRSISNTTYGSRTNTTVTAPSGITDGDVLLFYIFTGKGTSAEIATAPSGFSSLSGGTWPIAMTDGAFFASMNCWYKIASSESGDYTATHGVCNSQGLMIASSGGSGSAPASSTNFQTSGGTVEDSTAFGLTTAANDALVIVLGSDWGDTATNLTGPGGTTPTFTERLDVVLSHVYTGVLATAGATGNKTWAQNASNINPWSAVMIVIESASGGAPSSFMLLGFGK